MVRCAIYTHKSTELNLDLAFNSLDAQREACEAYIKSQAHEGWMRVPERPASMSAGMNIRAIWLSYIAGRELKLPQPSVSRIIATFDSIVEDILQL